MTDQDEPVTPRVEAPISLLPDLSEWGIEPVDTGVCEDTYENRRLIRLNGARWRPLYNTDGAVTNNIEVITSEMREAQLLANKSSLLTDSEDSDADYLTDLKLILSPGSEHLAPAWVLAATRQWIKIRKERKRRDEEEPTAKFFRPAISGAPGRCAATKIDGARCQNWHGGRADENSFCRMHVGNQPNREENVQVQAHTRARNRILSASLAATETLEDLMTSATSEVVRMNSANSILDRAGIRGGIEIDQTVKLDVTPAAEQVRERLARLQKGAQELEAMQQRKRDTENEQSQELIAEVVGDSE